VYVSFRLSISVSAFLRIKRVHYGMHIYHTDLGPSYQNHFAAGISPLLGVHISSYFVSRGRHCAACGGSTLWSGRGVERVDEQSIILCILTYPVR